jgi:hypothetical protein
MNELVKVKSGELASHQVRPYEYGVFSKPFEGSKHELGGGTFDPSTGRIYLTAQKADRQQGQYSNPPVVMAYEAIVPAAP